MGRACFLQIIACAAISVVPQVHGNAASRHVPPKLEARLAELKIKTAALTASGLAQLKALSHEQRLAAPPAIWRLPGALTEFKDCVGCPQMVVIPAGEFTMGSPPSEMEAEAQHRVTITYPFAVSKFEITANRNTHSDSGDARS